jgi:hypothetical protein
MDKIETITSPIGHFDAIRLKKWSDTYIDKSVPLNQIVDAKSVFIINTELERNQKKLDLTDDDVKHWYTKWTHIRLSEVVSKLWSEHHHSSKTIETAYEQVQINLNQLPITNIIAEQKLLTEIHDIKLTLGDEQSLLPDNQQTFIAILDRKLPKINPYYQDMQRIFVNDKVKYPKKTVMDWLNCFAYVRATGREIQAQASRFFPASQY